MKKQFIVWLSIFLSTLCIVCLRPDDAVTSTVEGHQVASAAENPTTQTVLIGDEKSLTIPCCTEQQASYLNAIIFQQQQIAAFFNWVTAMRNSKPPLLVKIMWCESGFDSAGNRLPKFQPNYHIKNARSTASGAGQVLNGTWNGVNGSGWKYFFPPAIQYVRAMDAPDWVQDAVLIEAFRRNGTRPWSASSGCWSRL